MRAGRLDRTITVERRTTAPDLAGVPRETWTAVATLRAQLLQAAAEEKSRAYGDAAEAVVVFRTRFFAGLTLADRIVFDGHAHDVREVKELGRRRGLEITAVARGGLA